MNTHPNARLTPVSRERLVRLHIQDAEPLAHLAAQAGISLRTAYKWLSRYRSAGAAALVDRLSVRLSQRRTLYPSICKTPLPCAMSAAPSGELPACWPSRSPPSAAPSKPLAWDA